VTGGTDAKLDLACWENQTQPIQFDIPGPDKYEKARVGYAAWQAPYRKRTNHTPHQWSPWHSDWPFHSSGSRIKHSIHAKIDHDQERAVNKNDCQQEGNEPPQIITQVCQIHAAHRLKNFTQVTATKSLQECLLYVPWTEKAKIYYFMALQPRLVMGQFSSASSFEYNKLVWIYYWQTGT
jgi:hypothetical protein